MGNLFFSKTIYKKLPNIPDDKNPLREVRGLYVSGEYREPFYIDHYLSIKDINISKPVVTNFYETTKSLTPESVLSVSSLDANEYVTIVRLTTKDIQQTPESTLSVSSLSAEPLTIVRYTSKSETNTPESVLSVSSLDSSSFELTRYDGAFMNTTPDHAVTILNMTTTQATIEDA